MKGVDLVKRTDPGRPVDEPRRAPVPRGRRNRRLSDDEAEYRLFAAAAGAAIVVLTLLVAALVYQMP